jgi:alpha-L-rhamnosidase
VTGRPTAVTALDDKAVKAMVLHSYMEPTGEFSCSNSLINKLHSNIRWGMKSNFFSIPIYYPQRDERLGWTGDAHAFTPTANFLCGVSGFWKSWLKDLYADQQFLNSMCLINPFINLQSGLLFQKPARGFDG